MWNELCDKIAKFAEVKKNSEALNYGAFRSVVLTNRQCVFERASQNERILVAVNADDQDYTAYFDIGCKSVVDLISGERKEFSKAVVLPGYSAYFWKTE